MGLTSLLERRVVASSTAFILAPREVIYAYLSNPTAAVGLSARSAAFHIDDVQDLPNGRRVKYTAFVSAGVPVEATFDQVFEPPRLIAARTVEARFLKGRRLYGVLRVRLMDELVWTLDPTSDLLSTNVKVEAAWHATVPTFISRTIGQRTLGRMLSTLAGIISCAASSASAHLTRRRDVFRSNKGD